MHPQSCEMNECGLTAFEVHAWAAFHPALSRVAVCGCAPLFPQTRNVRGPHRGALCSRRFSLCFCIQLVHRMAPRASRRKAVPAAPAAKPQTSAARKAPASKRKAVPEPEPEIKATKKRAIKQATVLEPVTHATHGKVRGRGRAGKRFRDRRGPCDAGGFSWPCHYVLDACDPLAARPSHLSGSGTAVCVWRRRLWAAGSW